MQQNCNNFVVTEWLGWVDHKRRYQICVWFNMVFKDNGRPTLNRDATFG